jgi:murein L,D-transpeptidase YcbB/YkuD
VKVSNSIAVLIFYNTAQVINDDVFFFDDIYGYDTVLNQALYKQSFVANADKWIN